MHLGNRRFIVVAAIGAVLAGALSGCSGLSADETLGSTNGEAVAIGQQALGFTSSGSSSTGWTSPIACPAGYAQGLSSTTPASDTILQIDPTTVTGPASDPQLTAGYVATCADRVSSATSSILELSFFDIDDAHAKAISTRLLDDGFVSEGTTHTTDARGDPYVQTVYQKGLSRIAVATVTVDSTPALIIAG